MPSFMLLTFGAVVKTQMSQPSSTKYNEMINNIIEHEVKTIRFEAQIQINKP